MHCQLFGTVISHLGLNRIKTVIKDVCYKAGLVGEFTNHSLRALRGSRMFDNDVPEQIIKEVTGHRSEYV